MKTLLAAITSMSLLAGAVTPALADHRDNDRHEWRRDNDRDRHASHDNRRDQRIDQRNYRSGYIDGRYDQRRYHTPRYHAPRYIAPRGYHARAWHRGDRLPAPYYSSRYIVRNYDSYRLYAPPRGHHWVRVDNDVLLTAVATGAVVAVVGGLFN